VTIAYTLYDSQIVVKCNANTKQAAIYSGQVNVRAVDCTNSIGCHYCCKVFIIVIIVVTYPYCRNCLKNPKVRSSHILLLIIQTDCATLLVNILQITEIHKLGGSFPNSLKIWEQSVK